MDVMGSVPLWRHPRAEAIQHDGTWYVAMPEEGQISVWPRGIRLEDNDAHPSSTRRPALDEILDDLYLTVSHDTHGQGTPAPLGTGQTAQRTHREGTCRGEKDHTVRTAGNASAAEPGAASGA